MNGDWRKRMCALVGAFVGLSTPALAQPAAEELETISQLAYLIRWRGVLVSLVVILAVGLFLRFIDSIVEGLSLTFTDRRLALQKAATFLRFGIYVLTLTVVILLSFHVSQEVLAIIGGTLAVATGFAMKDLAASVVAGIMIMMDRPFQVGDRVSFGGEYGDITAIGIRSVRMQTLDDNTITIPNNKFLTDITSSGNYGALDMQVNIDFYIGLDQDVRRAERIIREAAVTSRFCHLPKPVVVRISQKIVESYVAVQLRLKAYVLDTQYEKAFVHDVTMRVMDAFAEKGIQPPAILHRQVGNAVPPATASPVMTPEGV